MEDEKKSEAGLPEIIEPQKKQESPIIMETIKTETIKTDKNVSSKKTGKNNKIESPKSTDSLQELILKNIKLSEEIFVQNKKIKHRLTMMVFGSYLKTALVVVPLIFAYIYLGPILSQTLSQYSSLLGNDGATPNLGNVFAPGTLDLNDILKNISTQDAAKLQEMLKNSQIKK